jgi:hypothetical protein
VKKILGSIAKRRPKSSVKPKKKARARR